MAPQPWSASRHGAFGCAEPGLPGIYTRVSAVRSWIDATLTETPDIGEPPILDPVVDPVEPTNPFPTEHITPDTMTIKGLAEAAAATLVRLGDEAAISNRWGAYTLQAPFAIGEHDH